MWTADSSLSSDDQVHSEQLTNEYGGYFEAHLVRAQSGGLILGQPHRSIGLYQEPISQGSCRPSASGTEISFRSRCVITRPPL